MVNGVIMEYFIGIDLGGTNVELALVTESGNIATRGSVLTEVPRGPDAMVARATALYQELLSQLGIGAKDVKGLGIGTPGPLSVAQGRIINAGNLPGFDGFGLRAEFSKALGVAAVMDNDANSACWGEFWLGAGKGLSDMVMFTLGTGIGGGIITAGELVHGSQDNAAELGHMIIQPDGRKCSCGQRGCLEAYASASHTAARAVAALQDGRSSTLSEPYHANGTITCKDVFDHARGGDTLADDIVNGTARALAIACVNMRHISEPQAVVFAGGMINSAETFIPRVKSYYDEMMWHLKPEPMAILVARLGPDAGVIGAAGLAVHAHEQHALVAPGN